MSVGSSLISVPVEEIEEIQILFMGIKGSPDMSLDLKIKHFNDFVEQYPWLTVDRIRPTEHEGIKYLGVEARAKSIDDLEYEFLVLQPYQVDGKLNPPLLAMKQPELVSSSGDLIAQFPVDIAEIACAIIYVYTGALANAQPSAY